jgi:tetratricopeptide (TPR) repeat protein
MIPMSRFPFHVLLLALLAFWLPAQTIQLADGRVLLGEIDGSPDGEGMRVRRLDNGGVLELRWSHLSPASALFWKKKYDLAGDTQDEVTIRADEVEYVRESGRRTLLGRITEQTPEYVVVTVKGVPNRVPRTELRAVRKVDAPVLQVLTRDEYYQEQLAQRQPGNEADKHVLFAEDLIKVRDYDHATEHLQKAKELGSKNPAHVDALVAKLERFKAAAKELKALEEIQVCRSRGQLADFERGTKLLAQFDKDFPPGQSKLKAEADAEKKKFADARTRYLKGIVADKWRSNIQWVAEKALASQSLTLQAARDYAQNKMTDDIVARLASVLRLEPDEIKALWAARKDVPLGKRTELFAYGVGSWVLGEKAILKDTAAGKEADKQKGAQQPQGQADKTMEQFQKLFKAAFERRRQALQQQGGQDDQVTDEDWWRQAERAERISWLRAFYAENGGQLVVTYATVSPCISCDGAGTTLSIGGDGKLERNTCFLCQNTKYMRSFRAY